MTNVTLDRGLGNVEFVRTVAPALANEHSFRLTIEGEPVPKGRPRFSVVNGHVNARTPAKTRRYEDIVRQTAITQWGRVLLPKTTAIWVEITAYREVPASWSKRKHADVWAGRAHPISRPDLDNLVKSITDGLSGAIYADDSSIVETHARKVFGKRSRVEVTLRWQPQE